MGRGHNKIKKIIKYETSYVDKNVKHHKHEYNIKCCLKVVKRNKNSIFPTEDYFEVLKCQHCNSFISVPQLGNCRGHIDSEKANDYQNLPIIQATSNSGYLIYNFCDLQNVIFIDKNGK